MSFVWLAVFSAAAYWLGAQPQTSPPPSTVAAYRALAASIAAVSGGLLLFAAALLSLPMMWSAVLAAAAAAGAVWYARMLQRRQLRARRGFERMFLLLFAAAAAIAVATTLGIIAAVAAESVRFFSMVSVGDFWFGTLWSPQIAIREEQAGASGAFGFLPLFSGTMLITGIAMLVAGPMGLLIAIYLSEFASAAARARVKPMLEILAGVPTVVYGFFAVVTLSPILRELGSSIGVSVSGESALAAGMVMGIMLIPFVASLSEDALFAVPDSLRQGAFGLGSTRFETAAKVAMPAALPGIAAGMLLAVSRAIGETMIVVMAAGIAANLTMNPLEAVTTVTVQIVTLLTGDQEFDDPKTLAAFALGLALFLVTLLLNVIALHGVRRYQQRYE